MAIAILRAPHSLTGRGPDLAAFHLFIFSSGFRENFQFLAGQYLGKGLGWGAQPFFLSPSDSAHKQSAAAVSGLAVYKRMCMPSTHSLVLPVEMPFDWKAVLAFLRLRASPGVESVSDSAYMRTCGAGGAVQ